MIPKRRPGNPGKPDEQKVSHRYVFVIRKDEAERFETFVQERKLTLTDGFRELLKQATQEQAA